MKTILASINPQKVVSVDTDLNHMEVFHKVFLFLGYVHHEKSARDDSSHLDNEKFNLCTILTSQKSIISKLIPAHIVSQRSSIRENSAVSKCLTKTGYLGRNKIEAFFCPCALDSDFRPKVEFMCQSRGE